MNRHTKATDSQTGRAAGRIHLASNKLIVTTPSDLEIRMERTFSAPRDLVFEAFTKAEHVAEWWGAAQYEVIVDQLDFRVGGNWRFINRAEDGTEHGFRGKYVEIEPPERIVWTFEYEGMPGHISTETIEFTEHDGRTAVTGTSLFDSVEDRDGMLQSGMEQGANESYSRLERLLRSLVSAAR